MAWEAQRPVNGLVGELATGCTDLDTQISSSVFSGLPVDYSQTLYLPLILADDQAGTFEVVYAWTHVSTSTSVTVSRGMRGTTPQAWPQGTVVRCAPTTYDAAVAMTFAQANALTDSYVGQRAIDPVNKLLVTKSYQGNFYGNVQFGAGCLGPAVEGNAIPPIGASPLIQAGHAVGLTVNGGFLDWTLPSGPFPNGITSITATIYTIASDALVGNVKVHQSFNNGTQISLSFYDLNNVLVGNGVAANASVFVIGW